MEKRTAWNLNLASFKLPLLFLLIFYSVAIWRFLATGRFFYIYNFGYIGTSIAAGIFLLDALPAKHSHWGRRISQLLIGLYMVGYLGVIRHENMQIEGFFFYLFAGVFAGATLHYFIAKLVGVAAVNRGWCSWACWTAMVLDLLPWKRSPGRRSRLGILRYIHLLLSLGLVLIVWFILGRRNIYENAVTELYWLAGGNVLYYAAGIGLAAAFKDNRAFCKYLCPIPVLQKPFARFAILKIAVDPEKCTDCGLCERSCPVDVPILSYKTRGCRVLSTECILCTRCTAVCPNKAVSVTLKLDSLRRKK
jgi:polyferredoxin